MSDDLKQEVEEEQVINEESAPVDDDSSDVSEAEDLQKRIQELEEENSELKNQYLRKQADFENYRKRMAREKQEAIKYANTSLLTDLIGVIDNFELAIKSTESSQDFNSFHEGIQMIEKQFTSMLEQKHGLTRYESTGEVFDPSKHEAIAMTDSEEHTESVVLEDFQKGYLLNDRVIRPAKVRVANPKAPVEESTDNDENEE
ncbi:nucleotide exchange factor GrpE [Spirochaeta cellobiosiphila]|uniref:nucleotide exchange factor GrpE n=1 Tax=Spirochaeta cellobiosiphila TaxID=504483 RepID=UPI0004198C9D|nr:nucleotide exchange factor GrpE [Spirochaeta cellobiosiphila]